MFGGTSNALDFLPLDRSGNRRFIPVMVYPEQAEVHILEDEAVSRAYIEQMWAEAMEIYRSGRFKLAFSSAMQRYLKEHQRDFMPEDTKAGMIQAYLDKYTGSMVCSKQLYKEALNHAFDEPKQWEIREINEIMNQCIDRWRYFPNPRMFSEYGRQRAGSVKTRQRTPATRLKNDGWFCGGHRTDGASILKMTARCTPVAIRCRAGCRGKPLVSGLFSL